MFQSSRLSFLLALIPLLSGCQSSNPAPRCVVYVELIGDLFHPGHVNFLQQAKSYGDYLIVGLVTDEDAESYGKRRPIMTLAERAELVRSCRFVDEVIVGCPYRISDELIDQKQIDLVLHGDDAGAEILYYYYQAAIDRGLFKTIPYTLGISTSDLIERVEQRAPELLRQAQERRSALEAAPENLTSRDREVSGF